VKALTRTQIKNIMTKETAVYPVRFPCSPVGFVTRRDADGEPVETYGVFKFADGSAVAVRSAVSLGAFVELRRVSHGTLNAAPIRLHAAAQLQTPRDWRIKLYSIATGKPLHRVEAEYWNLYREWETRAYRAA